MRGAHRQAHERAGGRWAIYWYAYRGGPRIALYEGATRSEAEALEDDNKARAALMRAFADALDTRPAIGQFGRVIVDYIASDDYTGLKAATKATKRVWLDRMRDQFGRSSAAEITMDAVSAWLKAVESGHGKRARDHAKSALSSVAAWGRAPERDKEARLPGGFEPTKDFKNAYHAPPQDAWTVLEIEKLPKVCPYVRQILLLALNTGLRRADLCRVAWTNVDWPGGCIRLITSKGERKRRRIVVPLTRPLRALLQEIGVEREGAILKHAHGAWKPDGMAHAINRELSALGIKGRLHGLRRSAATHLAQQGAAPAKIARVLGWSQDDAEAMAAIYISDEAL